MSTDAPSRIYHVIGTRPTHPLSVPVTAPPAPGLTQEMRYGGYFFANKDGTYTCIGLRGMRDGCGKSLAEVSGSFSNLMKHARTCPCLRTLVHPLDQPEHGDKFIQEEFAARNAFSSPPSAARDPFSIARSSADKTKQKRAEMKVKLAQLVVSGLNPFNIAADPAFRSFVTSVRPDIRAEHFPHPTTIARYIKTDMYDRMRVQVADRLLAELGDKKTAFYCTYDTVTSRGSDCYLVCTLHYTSKEYKQRTVPLALIHLDTDSSADTLRRLLLNCLQLGYPDDAQHRHLSHAMLRGVTPDGASNVQKVFEDDPDMFVGVCFAHSGQLIWSHLESLDEFRALVKAAGDLIYVFHAAPKKQKVLLAAQKKLCAKDPAAERPTKLLLPPSHRWNYHHIAWRRLLQHFPAIQSILAQELYTSKKEQKEYQAKVNAFDEVAASIEALLPVLSEVALWSEFLSSRDITISYIPLAIQRITKAATTARERALSAEHFDPTVANIASSVLEQVKLIFGHWEEKAPQLNAAQVLDPRTAMYVQAAAMEPRLLKFRDAVENGEFFIPAAVLLPPPSDDDDVGHVDDDAPVNVHAAAAAGAASSSVLKRELATYTTLLASHSPKDDPALLHPWTFFKQHHKTLPTLAHLARNLLPFPATSAESERTFRYVKLMVTDNRASMAPETVEQLMMLYLWNRHESWQDILAPIGAAKNAVLAELDRVFDVRMQEEADGNVDEDDEEEDGGMGVLVVKEDSGDDVDSDDVYACAASSGAATGGAISGSKRKFAAAIGGAGTGTGLPAKRRSRVVVDDSDE